MSLSNVLGKVASGQYAKLDPDRRWGQLLREAPRIRTLIERADDAGRFVRLDELGDLSGGVVTRANAYFLVQELAAEQIPKRFRLTKRDLERVAVVMDGKKSAHRIERAYIRPIIKGPEALKGPFAVEAGDLRVFDVPVSKAELRKKSHTGALAYIKRGEDTPYNTSADSLKGGIPAKRSNVKNRKPYWYSLNIDQSSGNRIVLPEHVDAVYPASLIRAGDGAVVNDKLYLLDSELDAAQARVLIASLHSVLTWYQMESRGRTQLGQGVLELKKPDWGGVRVLDPRRLSDEAARELLEAFAEVDPAVVSSPAALGTADRLAFDVTYTCLVTGQDSAESALEALAEIEQEFRALSSERRERRESVSGSRVGQRRSAETASASIDAYATRIVAEVEAVPDPRDFLSEEELTERVAAVNQPLGGPVRVGEDLFDQGQVYAGENVILDLGDPLAARYAALILRLEPETSSVAIPGSASLRASLDQWEAAMEPWRANFEKRVSEVTRYVKESKDRDSIRARALELAHVT